MTADIDGDGKPVLIGIESDVEMDWKPVNAVRSVYGLDNPKQWLNNQTQAGKKLVIYNKKGANAFLHTYGYSASVEGEIELLNTSISNSGENVKGKVLPNGVDTSKIKGMRLTARQKSSVDVLKSLAKIFNVRFVLESGTGSEYGHYTTGGNVVHVDINANNGTILYTAARNGFV